ncbi:MAG: four helix bundle protein [Gammaproteobacteria bacterium]
MQEKTNIKQIAFQRPAIDLRTGNGCSGPLEKVVAGFSRYHKYTLGTELRNQSHEVVALIMKANAARDKRPHLLQLRECLDELLISVRIAKETKAFKNFKSFQFAIEQVVSVCKQNEGWLRSLKKVSA